MQKNFNLVSPKIVKNQDSLTKVDSNVSSYFINEIVTKCNDLRDQTIVIRLPANVITCKNLLQNFASNVKTLTKCGAKIFIVHDYTTHVDNILKYFGELDLNNDKLDFNYSKLQLIEMVLSGYVNKLIVTELCAQGCNAIGLSGKDGNLIKARQSTFLYRKSQLNDIIDIGSVSEPIMVSPEILLSLEEHELVSVVSPIACDDNGKTHLLDVTLTTAIIATAVAADQLILAYEEALEENLLVKPNEFKEIYNILKKAENFSLTEAKSGLLESVSQTISSSAENICFTTSRKNDFLLEVIFGSNTV